MFSLRQHFQQSRFSLDADALRNAGVSIWLAEYTNNERPAYREAYDYWQYSKTGRVPGIDGDADLDRVYA